LTKILLILSVSAILLYGCEKNTYFVENDPNYPTIIEKISPDQLNKLKLDFAQQNIYLITSLDEYGFCGYSDSPLEALTPPIDTTVSESEAIEIAKEFLSRNSVFTGIENAGAIVYRSIEMTYKRFWDGNRGWHLHTAHQLIDTIEVLNTYIHIDIRGKAVYYCVGNWYPDIYIPKEFNCDSKTAKELLLNKTVTHYGWGGPCNVVITSESLQGSTTRLYVLPVEIGDHTELHLTWCINIPAPVHFKIYVDVMTGEIIGEEPTIIA
jgi:hypothetical protein